MSSTRRKSAALGMPFGTACHRLRKQVLFSVLARHGENVCVRCGLPIENVEELSLEHKQPWEGVNAALFWDMDNLAFSHRVCNLPPRYVGTPPDRRKAAPAGQAWCQSCRTFQSAEAFARNRAHPNGLQNRCKACQAAVRRAP